MRFSAIAALILGAILTALEAIQLCAIPMSGHLHLGITIAISVLVTAGVLATGPAQIAALVPHHVLIAITALIGFGQAFQGQIGMSPSAHKVVAIVLVALGALFTSDGVPPVVSSSKASPVV